MMSGLPEAQHTHDLTIEAAPAARVGPALLELFSFGDTLGAFVERDIRIKYKQTVLGVGWSVVQPLVFVGIFTLAFGKFAHVSGGGVPYAAFALSAQAPWMFLTSAVLLGSNVLLRDVSLFRKVYFPREIPILGSVLSTTLDFGVALVVFMAVGPALGARPSLAWLLALPLVVPLVVLASGVALAFGALNVYYRDFRFLLAFALQVWLFCSPVIYPLSVVPERWRPLVALNPAAGLLDTFRHVLALGELPDPELLGISLVSTAAVFWLGYRTMKALEPNLADVA